MSYFVAPWYKIRHEDMLFAGMIYTEADKSKTIWKAQTKMCPACT
jgi:hypothetical protein